MIDAARLADAEVNARVNVSFFGRLADSIAPHIVVDTATGCSIAELREQLAAAHPAGSATLRDRRTRAIVDDSIVPDEFRPAPNAEVGFLPPVSGG